MYASLNLIFLSNPFWESFRFEDFEVKNGKIVDSKKLAIELTFVISTDGKNNSLVRFAKVMPIPFRIAAASAVSLPAKHATGKVCPRRK